jgi:hypothetical protein
MYIPAEQEDEDDIDLIANHDGLNYDIEDIIEMEFSEICALYDTARDFFAEDFDAMLKFYNPFAKLDNYILSDLRYLFGSKTY